MAIWVYFDAFIVVINIFDALLFYGARDFSNVVWMFSMFMLAFYMLPLQRSRAYIGNHSSAMDWQAGISTTANRIVQFREFRSFSVQ